MNHPVELTGLVGHTGPTGPTGAGITGATGPQGPGAPQRALSAELTRGEKTLLRKGARGPSVVKAQPSGSQVTTHRWELLTRKPAHDGLTRFEWHCRKCMSTTFTNGRGEETSRPGRRAMQATWVNPDCKTALVEAVHGR